MEIWYILKLSFLGNRERINGFETRGEERNIDSYLLVCTKTNFRWIKYLKHKINHESTEKKKEWIYVFIILKFGRPLWLEHKTQKPYIWLYKN